MGNVTGPRGQTGPSYDTATLEALQRLSQVSQQGLGDTLSITSVPTGAIETLAAWGRPTLDAPSLTDPGELSVLLGEVEAFLGREQMQNSALNLDANSVARKEASRKAAKNAELAHKHAQEAKEMSTGDKVLMWMQKIAVFVAAVLGAVAAGTSSVVTGPAGVLLTVAAVIGVAMALQDLINTGIQAAGVPATNAQGQKVALDVSFGGMVNAIVSRQLADGTIVVLERDKNGQLMQSAAAMANAKPGAILMDPAQLESWKTGWTVATTLFIAANVIAAGAGGAKAFADLAKLGELVGKLTQMQQQISVIAQTGETVGNVVGSALDIARAGVDIKTAYLNRDSEHARADQFFYDKKARSLDARMEMEHKAVEDVMKRLEEVMTNLSGLIARASDTTAARYRAMS